ncbi:uncharacterized protein LAJ45_06933 [Morchella importuna]|uniref:uncharacterized protein n=1 Tax=Morchella importuna TaxID=1174673 RepID=UPI001E8CCD16|nr:uncharacterized protein LAJ45_06933 [Morchella importuna]KAH8148958.1 hypothetical protein LAJ45_06933 [Morchella importuna]
MPQFTHLLHRLLCIPLPPRSPPKTDPHTISHPYNAHAAPLSSYRRATPPRRRPTRFTRRHSASAQFTQQPTQPRTPTPNSPHTPPSTSRTAALPSASPAPACPPPPITPRQPPPPNKTKSPPRSSNAPTAASETGYPSGLCKHCDQTAKSHPRPVSEAWTISAYERDSFCETRGSLYEIDERDSFCGPGTWGLEEEEEEQGEMGVEGGLDSPTLPYERFFTIGSQPMPPLVVVKRGRPEEEEVGSIDFKSSYYARLYRDWISVS